MSTPVTYRDLLIDRYKLVYDWVPEGTARILDVGCGNALFTQWLRQKAGSVVGVDHNPRNCRRGRAAYPELHLAASAAEGLPFPDAHFDCVVCSDTLEHTDDDQASVDELLRVLRPGGTLVLTMPQGGLFGWLDAENLVNLPFEWVRRLKIPKRGGGYRLESFRFRPHKHYSEGKVRRLIGERAAVAQVVQGGLFLYPFCYLLEKIAESFFGRDLVSADYRGLRRLRAWDFTCGYGPLAFNIAVRAIRSETP
ncbi:MAG: class I SAM-dependent methyltransferase [Fimbriimonadaceae bacterium]|nr:class I SAM-dependent methyltransferase [Fimbriimonadaceae bacterium]